MVNHIEVANSKSLKPFSEEYLPSEFSSSHPLTWTHPTTKAPYQISIQTSSSLSKPDLDACFNLIYLTSGEAYKKSKDGWKPLSKRKEMRLLDLKYLLVKREKDEEVEGFLSFMPTYEDKYPVIYCYEIHLSTSLQGSGLGKVLMGYLDVIGAKIEGTKKVMLTCFLSNTRGIAFYEKLCFGEDEYSPKPRKLRNGKSVEVDYIILSKRVTSSTS